MSVSRFCPCLGYVLSRICRVQDMSVSRICPCLGYVLSRFGRVQVWSCLGLVCLGFVLSRICLSRFGPGTVLAKSSVGRSNHSFKCRNIISSSFILILIYCLLANLFLLHTMTFFVCTMYVAPVTNYQVQNCRSLFPFRV